MTKEDFVAMWTEELKECEEQYKDMGMALDIWYRGSRRGSAPQRPDYTVFRNRFESRFYHIYKDELEQLPEAERIAVEREAATMMLDKLRDMEIDIDYSPDLKTYIELDPKNIEYIDLLDGDEDSFLAEMIGENPEVLNHLSMEKIKEISGGRQEFIIDLVKSNTELVKHPTISEIIASDPALIKETTIVLKEIELDKLKVEVAQKEQELEQLKGKERTVAEID